MTGARSTAEMTGGRGRSGYLGHRVLGTPDPGAIGAALLLTALADVHEPHVAIHPRLRLDRGGGGHMHQPAVAPSCTPHVKTRRHEGAGNTSPVARPFLRLRGTEVGSA
ncbi:DAK2 domain-containing protein [Streptomyces sp. CA2R106]|uniref:DAK2 domain-containing protein n=1 Tax=Streptomyces sp. CA2R106 TaxID=3120153 RepID=UPI00300B8AD1